MSSLDDLIGTARMLLGEGHSPGHIADELSLSMETVTWLLTQAKGTTAPKDVHIDWSAVSSQAPLLEETALMLLRRYYQEQDSECASPAAEVVVGIALSGIRLQPSLLYRKLHSSRSTTRQSRTRAKNRWDRSAGTLLLSAVSGVLSSMM